MKINVIEPTEIDLLHEALLTERLVVCEVGHVRHDDLVAIEDAVIRPARPSRRSLRDAAKRIGAVDVLRLVWLRKRIARLGGQA